MPLVVRIPFSGACCADVLISAASFTTEVPSSVTVSTVIVAPVPLPFVVVA